MSLKRNKREAFDVDFNGCQATVTHIFRSVCALSSDSARFSSQKHLRNTVSTNRNRVPTSDSNCELNIEFCSAFEVCSVSLPNPPTSSTFDIAHLADHLDSWPSSIFKKLKHEPARENCTTTDHWFFDVKYTPFQRNIVICKAENVRTSCAEDLGGTLHF